MVIIESSSGGAFNGILRAIDDNSYVYGATFNEDLEVKHKSEFGINKFTCFSKSKYIQSNLDDCFKEILALLNQNKNVVFSGLPCQIAGLRSFLKKKYSNLFCIELICNGVASPGLFSSYIKDIEKYYVDKVTNYTFRYKKNKKAMWRDFYIKIDFLERKSLIKKDDSFMKGYLAKLFMRESCVDCRYAQEKRVGDIVIGDFWGVEKDNTANNSQGYSIIICISDKSITFIKNLREYMKLNRVSFEEIKEKNPTLYKPNEKNVLRDSFFTNYSKAKSYSEVIHKYIHKDSFPLKLKRAILFYYRKCYNNFCFKREISNDK